MGVIERDVETEGGLVSATYQPSLTEQCRQRTNRVLSGVQQVPGHDARQLVNARRQNCLRWHIGMKALEYFDAISAKEFKTDLELGRWLLDAHPHDDIDCRGAPNAASRPPSMLPYLDAQKPDMLIAERRIAGPLSGERAFPNLSDVLAYDVSCRTIRENAATIEEHHSTAHGCHSRKVVTDEDYGAPAVRYILHLAEALALEGKIAYGKHFIHNEDLGLQVRGDGEREPHVHATRVALDGRVEKTADLAEIDDLVELAPDLGTRHAEDRTVELDVLAAGELGVETRADLEQAATRPRISTLPSVGSVMCERTFSRVVLPEPLRPMIPSASTVVDLKVDVSQGPQIGRGVRGRAGVTDALERSLGRVDQAVAKRPVAFALAADAVPLAEADSAQPRRPSWPRPHPQRSSPSA